jgi:hypothetical protein
MSNPAWTGGQASSRLLFLAVMILFTMADYWTRGWVPDPGVTPAAPKYYRP